MKYQRHSHRIAIDLGPFKKEEETNPATTEDWFLAYGARRFSGIDEQGSIPSRPRRHDHVSYDCQNAAIGCFKTSIFDLEYI